MALLTINQKRKLEFINIAKVLKEEHGIHYAQQAKIVEKSDAWFRGLMNERSAKVSQEMLEKLKKHFRKELTGEDIDTEKIEAKQEALVELYKEQTRKVLDLEEKLKKYQQELAKLEEEIERDDITKSDIKKRLTDLGKK